MQPTTGFNLFFDKGDIEITYFVVLERIPDVTYLLHLVSLPRAAALPSGKGGVLLLRAHDNSGKVLLGMPIPPMIPIERFYYA